MSSCSSSDDSNDKSADRPSFPDCEGAHPHLFEPYDSDGSSGTNSQLFFNDSEKGQMNTSDYKYTGEPSICNV